MEKQPAALVVTLFAFIITTLSSIAFAGSGAAPYTIDSDFFFPSSVRHLPGSKTVEVYGMSNRAGTAGGLDACRLKAVDNGVSNSWSFDWLTGLGRTAAEEGSTMICPPASFCDGKIFVVKEAVVYYGDLGADGLTVSNVSAIPNHLSSGGLAVTGNKIMSTGDYNRIVLVEIDTGSETALSSCNFNGYAQWAMGSGPAGGFLYIVSDYNGIGGSRDLWRQPFNGSACTGGRINLNSVPGYGDANTSDFEGGAGVDPLTGDVYYFVFATYRTMRLKLTPKCGDGFISGLDEPGGEQCDPTSPWPLNAQTCTSLGLGFTGGTLKCNSSTCQFDTSECTLPASCGDGSCNGSETCASCPQDCGACCGNGVVDPGEQCDGSNLGGATCSSVMGAGYTGSLSCSNCSFVTSGCSPPPSCGDGSCNGSETCSTCPQDCGNCCGNGAIDPGEQCDGSNLGGATCSSVMGTGYTGSLSCSDCSFVTSGCVPLPSCGDGSCNGSETCANCPQDCGNCCGNGVIDSGEQCDGSNLNGATCSSVMGAGYTGSLSCSACSFVTTACTFGWGLKNLSGACSLSGDGSTQTVNFSGGSCTAEYWPIGAVTPAHIKWASVAGKALLVAVANNGQATTVQVPQGVSHEEIVDNSHKWTLAYGAGVEAGPEGTTWGAVEQIWPEVVFECTEGWVMLKENGQPLPFTIPGNPQGRLPAGWGVGVNVLTGTVTAQPFDLGGGGSAGAGGEAGAGGSAGDAGSSGSSGSAGDAGTGGIGGSSGDAGSGGMGGSSGDAGIAGSAGNAGSGGSAGYGGDAATGGSSAVGGSSGNAGSGGSADAGTADSGVSASNSADSGGCGACTTGSGKSSHAGLLVAGLLALAVSQRRSTRERQSNFRLAA